MSIDKDYKNNFINKLIKLNINKKIAENIENAINNFCNNYTQTNNIPYLIQSIYETKMTEILSYLELKNSYLLNAINTNNIIIDDIPNLNPDQLNPEQFEDIKKQQNLKEAKSNSKKGTTAFPCPKCKKSNSKLTEKQMRSGDEPPTTFITCLECHHTHRL
jgi:DNA-directed RNA polymerase subunit M/transcription elongation factor TFIIS